METRGKEELYGDWSAFFEEAHDKRAVDTEQFMEANILVEQTNGKIGSSAGGPRDAGHTLPLRRKPRRASGRGC